MLRVSKFHLWHISHFMPVNLIEILIKKMQPYPQISLKLQLEAERKRVVFALDV